MGCSYFKTCRKSQARNFSSYSEKDGKRGNEGFLFLFLPNNPRSGAVLVVSITLEEKKPSQLHHRPLLTSQKTLEGFHIKQSSASAGLAPKPCTYM